ncbi:SET domain protein [Gregarina niphandrodes]|uniref:SET domain protein n=1 Tax=Gregarina niphandrodes TaxID=110365 RepID=A0A023BBH2_GRENI|nr:SET domain protein [Gregarina niphandrodes]EZG79252.1 SET domain protein [Gregarina niphandrodes]|eukprot:XP_011129099.1 SET domain protein [Gregarina niphandrodes]
MDVEEVKAASVFGFSPGSHRMSPPLSPVDSGGQEAVAEGVLERRRRLTKKMPEQRKAEQRKAEQRKAEQRREAQRKAEQRREEQRREAQRKEEQRKEEQSEEEYDVAAAAKRLDEASLDKVEVYYRSGKDWVCDEGFMRAPRSCIGKAIYSIFALGIRCADEEYLAQYSPSVFWNLHLLAQVYQMSFLESLVHCLEAFENDKTEFTVSSFQRRGRHSVEEFRGGLAHTSGRTSRRIRRLSLIPVNQLPGYLDPRAIKTTAGAETTEITGESSQPPSTDGQMPPSTLESGPTDPAIPSTDTLTIGDGSTGPASVPAVDVERLKQLQELELERQAHLDREKSYTLEIYRKTIRRTVLYYSKPRAFRYFVPSIVRHKPCSIPECSLRRAASRPGTQAVSHAAGSNSLSAAGQGTLTGSENAGENGGENGGAEDKTVAGDSGGDKAGNGVGAGDSNVGSSEAVLVAENEDAVGAFLTYGEGDVVMDFDEEGDLLSAVGVLALCENIENVKHGADVDKVCHMDPDRRDDLMVAARVVVSHPPSRFRKVERLLQANIHFYKSLLVGVQGFPEANSGFMEEIIGELTAGVKSIVMFGQTAADFALESGHNGTGVSGMHHRRRNKASSSVFDQDGFQVQQCMARDRREKTYSDACSNDYTAPVIIATNGDKGRGVFAASTIYKGDFVCEYKGMFCKTSALIKQREDRWERLQRGSYIFCYKSPIDGQLIGIDATEENVEYGWARLVNHSHQHPNLEITLIKNLRPTKDNNRYFLAFRAARDIMIGEELLIDYGERRKTILERNPWLINS